MSKFKQFIPFSLLSAVAATLALVIAWEPEPAIADRPTAEIHRLDNPMLRMSIVEMSGAQDPFCSDAVWPNITTECLLFADKHMAERSVRTIVAGAR